MGSPFSKKKPKITQQDTVVLVSSQGLKVSCMTHQALVAHKAYPSQSVPRLNTLSDANWYLKNGLKKIGFGYLVFGLHVRTFCE